MAKPPIKPVKQLKAAPPQSKWTIEQSKPDAKGDAKMMKGKKGC